MKEKQEKQDKWPWAEKQFTKEEAIALHKKEKGYEHWEAKKIFELQINQRCLCMEFSTFQAAAEKVLGRGVWTHEFADRDRLLDEYFKLKPKATMDEILEVAPSIRKIVIIK